MNFFLLFLYIIINFIFSSSSSEERFWKLIDYDGLLQSRTVNLTSSGFRKKYNRKNIPGSRQQGCMAYFNGSIYLFGGMGYDAKGGDVKRLSDTWQYSIKKKKWRWIDRMDDAQYANFPAWYGTEYTNLNHPGSRSGHGCSTYVNGGSVFLYGGINVDKYKSDVFELNTKKRQWRWYDVTEDGETREENIIGVYGSKKYKTDKYRPGARAGFCQVGYKDSFYIFGGFGIGHQKVTGWLADLWEFDILAGKWRHKKTGEQGLLAIASSLNYDNPYPGSRDMHKCWVYNNKLYMYAGRGYSVRENDLWEFDFYTNHWKFTGYEGNLQAAQQHPVWKLHYTNEAYPGVRESYVIFQDSYELYFWGGKGKSARSVTGKLGDLWIYHHDKMMWKWVDTLGDKKTQKQENFLSVYGTKFDKKNYPSARENAMTVTAEKDFYLFGGEDPQGLKSDLWVLGFKTEEEKIMEKEKEKGDDNANEL